MRPLIWTKDATTLYIMGELTEKEIVEIAKYYIKRKNMKIIDFECNKMVLLYKIRNKIHL